ncbi:MAG: hypothetical protein EPO65_08160 [Dehalococcoidia bacterium]|nr:MAG: hypothetical protein EPO65_08160 [Dehalococcoidia bacterium]
MLRSARWLVPPVVLAAVISFLSPGAATAQTLTACPTGVTMTIAAPTAAAPTTVNVTVTPPQNIKAATAGDTTSFHLHYFIDTPATAAGAVIPSGDAKIIHSGTTTQDLGTLAAGSHTVIAVLGQLNHTACDARATVTFTTAAATTSAPAAAPAKTGNAGLAEDGSTSLLLVGSLVGVAFVLTAGARKASRRRS